MRIKYFLGLAYFLAVSGGYAQFKKQFFVSDHESVVSTTVNLFVNSGNCFVRPTKQPGILNIYSNINSDSYNHTYNKLIEDGVCDISLNVETKNQGNLGKTISSNIFGSSNIENQALWKVFFTEGKPYDINFKYGVGSANIDLSGLAVKSFKLHSGSADVLVGYNGEAGNTVRMDTFFVKVDMGDVKVKNLIQANSRYVITDVGFGSVLLDFSGRSQNPSFIQGNVGAGTLLVILPEESIPVKLKINDNFFCKVRLPHGFTKIEENVFVNKAYNVDSENLMDFNLDVSMGNLIFKRAD